MFNSVTDSTSSAMLPRGTYQFKVVRFEESEGMYGPQNKWVLHVATADGKPIMTPDGQPMEKWEFTGKNLTKHPKNKARPWFEAFLGRPLADKEAGPAVAQAAIGKKAMGFVDEFTVAQGPNAGQTRSKIASLWPIGGEQPPTPTANDDDNQDVIPF